MGKNDKKPAEVPVEDIQATNQRRRLLNRVCAWYHQAFLEDARGMDYLAGRGLTDTGMLGDFVVGFCNGTILNTIPDEGDLQATLKELGVLDGKGREVFYGCVVFPWFDENADCRGLWGLRALKGDGPEVGKDEGLYLPGDEHWGQANTLH